MRLALAEVLFNLAVITAVFWDATPTVKTLKVAELNPAATVTDTGGIALGSLLVNFTVEPPLGAGPVNVTVP